MADRKYTFPEGTTRIDPKNLRDAFCNYEIVEIPGTVAEVETSVKEKIERGYVLKRLILNEGTIILHCRIGCIYEYNTPSTLIKISCNGIAPKVVCLKQGFQEAQFSSFGNVEYLQAYTTADVRYSDFDKLKHYVYLGESIKNWGHSPFENIPSGCVIHVENKRMAKSVLKKCDVFNHYVVVDAAEWKDFPAEKLALTMEEYDPESRILPVQIKMREEKRQKQEEEEEKEQAVKRKLHKETLIEEMSKQVISPKLDALLGPETFDGRYLISQYGISVEEDDKTGEFRICIGSNIAVITENQGFRDKALNLDVVMNGDDIAAETDLLCEHIAAIKSFVDENIETIRCHEIHIYSHNSCRDCPTPGISLPYFDKKVTARINLETMTEDMQTVRTIVDKLTAFVEEGRKAFPKGFTIIERG